MNRAFSTPTGEVLRTGIYEIVCAPTGKRYIGSAVDFEKRWKLHRHHLARGTHHSRHLQSAWLKHGPESFSFRRLLVCARPNLVMYEQRALDALQPEFNIARTAGSCLGVRHSDETRRKLSASKLGNKHTLGYRHSPEAIEKLRQKQLGVSSPTKGTKRPLAAVAATAEKHRGMKRSEETRRRISEAAKGRKPPTFSAETRAKLSLAMKARPLNLESIARMAATKRGSTLTEEHKARIGEASRRAWARIKAAT